MKIPIFLRRIAVLTPALFLLASPGLADAPPAEAKPPDVMTAPQWLDIKAYGGCVSLRWFRVQGAAAYGVFKRVGEEGTFTEVARTKNPVYDDLSIAAGRTFFYKIVPYDEQSRGGPPSEVRFFRLEGDVPAALMPPEWSVSRMTAQGIALSWTHKLPASILAYNLYRRDQPEAGFVLVASSMDSTFLDGSVQPGKSYQYVLTALNRQLEESDFSSVLSVKYQKPKSDLAIRSPFASVKTLDTVLIKTEAAGVYGREKYGFISPVDLDYLPSTGNLYVSDAGTGQIVVINSRGEVIARVGGRGKAPGEFDRLLGIAVDARGFLYAVDAYRGEIVVFDPRFQFVERIYLLKKVEDFFGESFRVRYPAFRFGLVDLAIGGGGSLIISDNASGWLYRLDAANNLVDVIGGKGEDPGSLHYPTFVLLDGSDDIIVSDSLNSRLQLMEPSGDFRRIIGERGLGIGQFIRPKGLAMDARGNLYVADSFLNVIQVFTLMGDYVGILVGDDGLPLDLGLPNGMVFTEPDVLAVCEKIPGRIQFRRVPVGTLKTTVRVATSAAIDSATIAAATPRLRIRSQNDQVLGIFEDIRRVGEAGGILKITQPLFEGGTPRLLPEAFPVLFEIANLAKVPGNLVRLEVSAVEPRMDTASLALAQERVGALWKALGQDLPLLAISPISRPPEGEVGDWINLLVDKRR